MGLTRYDPPGELADFDAIPGQRDRWSDMLSHWFDSVIANDVAKRIHPGDRSQYVNQMTDLTDRWIEQRIVWNAFPATVRSYFGRAQGLEMADGLYPRAGALDGAAAQALGITAAAEQIRYRLQDEYCEWHVDRDAGNRIVRVTFTSEPPEYWQALHGDTLLDPVTAEPLHRFPGDRALLLDLYRTHVGPQVAPDDLVWSDDVIGPSGNMLFRKGEYNPYNRWNTTDGIMHLTHPVNSLGAEIVLGGEATVLRANASGRLITDPEGLICGAGFGGANRASDPTIGSTVNQLAQLGCALTLRNPVGLYMHHLDMSGFARPDGTPIGADYLTVVRGDATRGLIERAVFAVPAGENLTVSDLTVGGEPIRWGGQIAEHMTMNLVALAGPPGAFHNTPVGCGAHCCAADDNPDYLAITYRQGCGPGQHAVFDASPPAPGEPRPLAWRSPLAAESHQ